MTPGRNLNMDLGLHLNFDHLEGFGDMSSGIGDVTVKIEGVEESTAEAMEG